jgi:ribose transport system substrate-binding protein
MAVRDPTDGRRAGASKGERVKLNGKALFLVPIGALAFAGTAQAVTIGVSFPDGNSQDAVVREFTAAKAQAAKKGVKIVIDDPGSDLQKQIATINTWIQKKYDAVVVQGKDPATLEATARKARAAGVKWVTYAAVMKNQDATLGFDHIKGGCAIGTSAGKYVNAKLGGKAKVALLTWESGQWARSRRSGIERCLKKTSPGAQIVARQDAISTTDGNKVVRTLIQRTPDLNVILAVEETATEGGYQALLSAGRKPNDPKLFLAGIDGTTRALKLIKQGNNFYRASAALNLVSVGQGMVDEPLHLLAGKKGDYLVPLELVTSKDQAKLAKYIKILGG